MRKFGLIGEKLGHSFSKSFFSDYFTKNGIDASYENIELKDIESIQNVFNEDYAGFNVTIPYKEKIVPFLDELDEVVQEIRSVNVVKQTANGWKGYNSDVYGFHQMIKPFLTNKHEKALIFGTGGASKAVQYVLEKIGIEVYFVSQNPKEGQFSYDDLNEFMISQFKLLVNTTPVGMYPNSEACLNIPYQGITNEHLLVDLIYNPEETVFLKKGKEKGATILNGNTMLKQQALKSWEIWNS